MHDYMEYQIMRTEFVQAASRSTAVRRCPWAAKIAKVDGGWMAFESIDDYMTWRAQK
jgi:hypothetical protein